ncbi:hypothetical protein Tco_1480489 [Tanacetum coccineum]
MLNSSNGLFLFKFNFKDGMDRMYAILEKVKFGCRLVKEDVGNVPVWVKFLGVPMTMFSEDGLITNSTKLGTSFILDTYTSYMCMESWGRCSSCKVFGHDRDECPKKIVLDVMKNLSNPRQAVRGVQFSVITSGKKKQLSLSRQEVSNSNSFDALNSVENDNDLGTNEGISKSAGKVSLTVAPGSSSTRKTNND